uniref:Zn(2)-C6 fungal-type domain-containing protein n=1 Tax=Kwoniella bestiolae CBS 10118 TaxID=1296100 RepID=A0A1B9GGN3_9TREE|nr:hypothetical protein I302_01630 [Kwoniella bestiolae CBS 10118]OCF30111.1 hypothetical protein I302_01630 [Kwoniella bestiolae CBS 10118]
MRSSSITPSSQNRVACKRCSIRKRKCDKLQPRCTACVEADVECESGVKGVERNLLMQTQELQRRIDWLEGLIRDNRPSLHDISSISTGSPLIPHAAPSTAQPRQEGFDLPTLVSAGISMQRAVNMPDQGYVHGLSPSDNRFNSGDLSISSAAQHPRLPSIEKALEIVNLFLARQMQSHHCVTKEGIEEDLRLVYGENGLTDPKLAGSRFRCFSVIYLETSPAYHGGDHSLERSIGLMCRSLAMKEISNVLAKEDLTAVQALTLLCIYGVDIPGGPSLSQLVGFAARAAMLINIHRRDDIYIAPMLGSNQDKASFQKHNELRKNIFWAIYCLDRLASFTLGQPLSIRDSDVDVDNDSLLVEVSGTALRRHQIHLRRLYGIVRETFYSASVNSSKSMEGKEQVVADFVRQAQAWYNQSPLKAAFVPISEATVSRQVVDDISYHQMIMAAHRPSPLIPEIPSSFVMTLKYSASLSIDLYRHYCKSKKVLIIWTHLYQIFMSCTTLIYCFNEFHQRKDLVDLDENEIDIRIEQCKDLLAKFGTSWPESSRYQIMFDNLVHSFRSQIQNQDNPTAVRTDEDPIDLAIWGNGDIAGTTTIPFERIFDNNIVRDYTDGEQHQNQPQGQQIFSSNTVLEAEGEISPSVRDNSQIESQPDVSIFDLFGNFPMLDPASNTDGLPEATTVTTTDQLFGSMGPPWEYSPGSLGSMNSVMGM